jgi:adenylyl- and sulfurtransferase ThiI
VTKTATFEMKGVYKSKTIFVKFVTTFLKTTPILQNMGYNTILLRPGEIFLKGKNRNLFENKLVSNIKKIAFIDQVKKLRGRFIVDYFDNHNLLKNVFGLTSYSLAIKIDRDVEEIKKEALKLLQSECKSQKTFRVETKRSDKSFPIKSPELSISVGKFIEENSNFEFKFKNQDITLHIEINQSGVYLFIEKIDCFGGLPTGVEGKVFLLVENKFSILAGLMFMKRGCFVVPVAYSEKDISLLQKFYPQEIKLKIVKDFSAFQKFSEDYHLDALVVGDNFETKKEYQTDLLIFRPLIAFSGEEIEEKLEEFS